MGHSVVAIAVEPLMATADMEHPGATAAVELSWATAVMKYLGIAATIEPSRALAVMKIINPERSGGCSRDGPEWGKSSGGRPGDRPSQDRSGVHLDPLQFRRLRN